MAQWIFFDAGSTLVDAPSGEPLLKGCRNRMRKAFLAPKLYEYTASGQKTLKRAKTMTKAL